MAISYTDLYNAVNAANFQSRCWVAVWKAAQDIVNEDQSVFGHTQRYDWAIKVLRDELNITGRQLAIQVCRNPTIANDPIAAADGDIQFQINSIIGNLMVIG